MGRKRNNKLERAIREATRGTPQRRVVATEAEKYDDAVMIRTTPIMWGIPCDEVMYSKFFAFFQKHANAMPWDGFAISEGTYLPKARNIIHNAFLAETTLPYLQMLDSDILFPKHIVEKLMAHDLPIVGGWYRDKNHKDHHPVVYDFVSETEEQVNWRHRNGPGEGLERVDGMGAGCWLMRRDVAEALGESPYNMQGGGEDMILSRKLMELDIPLHVDWSLNLAHVGVGIT